MTQTVIHPIPPLYNKHSRVLLLGSIPSGASRAAGFFYAHPRNRFWQVIPAVFNETLPSNTTDSRKQFALAHQIALWDVLHSCEINGAADSSIISLDIYAVNAHNRLYGITLVIESVFSVTAFNNR